MARARDRVRLFDGALLALRELRNKPEFKDTQVRHAQHVHARRTHARARAHTARKGEAVRVRLV